MIISDRGLQFVTRF
jgi:hypothetical protein